MTAGWLPILTETLPRLGLFFANNATPVPVKVKVTLALRVLETDLVPAW